MKRHQISIGQTFATLIADEVYHKRAEKVILEKREELHQYIKDNPLFSTILESYEMDENAPDIVQLMIPATRRYNIGPMAAVAGAIGQYVIEDLIEAGSNHAVFDNGGDIVMHLASPIVVGIYTGSEAFNNIGLRVEKLGRIFSVCTSSATIGHSLSLGVTDASIVFSSSGIVADAAATYLGNQVKRKSDLEIEAALKKTMGQDIEGAIVIVDDKLGKIGDVPEIVRAQIDFNLIAKG